MTEVIMGGFTKLFSRILTSSIWSESNEVRIVWITLLAATGPDGIARVTLPGLSRLSNIPLPETEIAVGVLTSPDAYSRTVEHDGRRIREERDERGNLLGFFVFNYSKHRAVDATAADRQRKRRVAVTRDRHARQKTEDRRQKQRTETDNGFPAGAGSDGDQPPVPATPAEAREVALAKLGPKPRPDTWLTPFGDAWRDRWGQESEPPWGELARALRKPNESHGSVDLLARWVRYLAASERADWSRPARFVQGLGQWAEKPLPIPSRSSSPKDQRRRSAIDAAIRGGLLGDGTSKLGGGS